VVDPSPPEVDDGAISDARRRAHRRRIRIGIAAATLGALAALGVGFAGAFGGNGVAPGHRTESADVPSIGYPPTGDPTELVSGWAEFHRGWAYVFADGRVVRSGGGHRLLEQRLSAYGLALLRLGRIDAEDVAIRPGSIPDAGWWDRTLRVHRTTSYAVCPGDPPGSDDAAPTEAAAIEHRLPEVVRRYVAGTSRSLAHGDYAGTAPAPATAVLQSCFIVPAAQAAAMWSHTSRAPGDTTGRDGVLNESALTFGSVRLTDGTELVVWAQPLLPDGSAGSWGG
jgi:hypothetical protein